MGDSLDVGAPNHDLTPYPVLRIEVPVAMETISGHKTIQEIAVDHAIHPIQVNQWKKPLLDGASELFTRGKEKEEGQAKEAELFQQNGKLQMELEWLKKKSQLL